MTPGVVLSEGVALASVRLYSLVSSVSCHAATGQPSAAAGCCLPMRCSTSLKGQPSGAQMLDGSRSDWEGLGAGSAVAVKAAYMQSVGAARACPPTCLQSAWWTAPKLPADQAGGGGAQRCTWYAERGGEGAGEALLGGPGLRLARGAGSYAESIRLCLRAASLGCSTGVCCWACGCALSSASLERSASAGRCDLGPAGKTRKGCGMLANARDQA